MGIYHLCFALHSFLPSCTKRVGTHALLIISTFIIKIYAYKMTYMTQYPCFKHASSPSLPRQVMLVYTCLLFNRSALWLTALILGAGKRTFITKCPNNFVQVCESWFVIFCKCRFLSIINYTYVHIVWILNRGHTFWSSSS